MRIKHWNYKDGKFIMNLVDDQSKPLGIFIATDFELIKTLRRNNLNKVRLVFEYG
ncbi:MAG: hypothetical protein QQN60_08305 [Nitrosopumilus sp.]